MGIEWDNETVMHRFLVILNSKNGLIRLRNLATSGQVSPIIFLSNEHKLYILKNLLFPLPLHNFPKKENETKLNILCFYS